LAISAGIGIGFGPCVAAGARPDAFFGRGQAADLGFELVPQRLALALCISLEVARGRLQDALALEVFGDVVFGVDVGGSCGNACNCACYGCFKAGSV
jgi:hypothetical protein